jgi:uncharacterized protein DUF4886
MAGVTGATKMSSSAPMRLLFVGNSFTNRNDLPVLLVQLAAAGDPPRELTAEKVIASGASLRQHWNAGEAGRLLEQERWDVVVLQEQSTLPVKNRQRYHENVRLFHPVIQQQGARTALYLTWARRDAPERQKDLNEAVQSIGEEIGALVVPVGVAWERIREGGAGPELYDADGSHPSKAGSYLAACVFYAAFLGRSPEGLPANLSLSAEEAALLQKAAWASV